MTVEVAGHEFDPTITTVSDLTRVGDGALEAIIAWVRAERASRAARIAETEEHVARVTAELREGMQERHAAQAAWASRNMPGL